jgi:hypothetical protein
MILFSLLPFTLLFLGGIFTLSIQDNEKRFEVTSFILGFSLLVNTFLLFMPGFTISHNSIEMDRGNLLLSESILLLSFIFSIKPGKGVKNSKFADYFGLIYLILVASFVGISLSHNVLISVFFFIMSMMLVFQVFYFGEYEKDFFQVRNFLGVAVLSFIFVSTGAILLYISRGSFNLNHLQMDLSSGATVLDLIALALLVLGLGSIVGMVPFGLNHLKDYFEEANPLSLKVFNILFMPGIAIFIFKLIKCFTDTDARIGLVLFIIGGSGLIISVIRTVMELFGKFKQQSYSLKKILGYLSVSDFNILILLFSASIYASAELKQTTYSAIMLFILGISLTKAFIYEALNPIFDDKDNEDMDLKLLGGYYKEYPSMFYVFVLGIITMLFPYLPGNLFVTDIVSFIFTGADDPVRQAYLILIFILITAYMVVFCISYSIIAAEIFFGKEKYPRRTEHMPFKSNYLITPIILICMLAGIVIGKYFLPDLFTTALSELMDFVI